MRPSLCRAALPTAVGGAHNSPTAYVTIILLNSYLQFLVSYPRRIRQLVVNCFAGEHKRTSRIGRDSNARPSGYLITIQTGELDDTLLLV